MFGLNKLKEAKEKAIQMKAALSQLDFEGKSQNGMVSIQCSGDKRFHTLEIKEEMSKIMPNIPGMGDLGL
jgi:DNA-binding protein YbaB